MDSTVCVSQGYFWHVSGLCGKGLTKILDFEEYAGGESVPVR